MIRKESVSNASRRLGDIITETDETWRSVSSFRMKAVTLKNQEAMLLASIRSLRREIRSNEKELATFSKVLEGTTHEPMKKDLTEIIQQIRRGGEIASKKLAWRERRLESMRVKIESTSAEVNALDGRLDELTDSRNLIIRSLTACVSEEAVLYCG